jgi:hypothetical protein
MRQEANQNVQETSAHTADGNAVDPQLLEAFQYLKSLPDNNGHRVLESYRRGRNLIIADEVAETFTDNFRGASEPFYIPVSWSMSKASLVNLLGITSYTGHAIVNGVRFYAGLNGDNQLTLIAVSTQIGVGCDNDLTIADNYPYYDYANPCPDVCAAQGSLRSLTPVLTKVEVIP